VTSELAEWAKRWGSRYARSERIALPVLLVVACAAYVYATFYLKPGPVAGSFDVYAAHYPNVLYALDSLGKGHGLLWNNLQNCGQPFVPMTLVGLFYPPQLIFLLLEPNAAYMVIVGFHLAVVALGTYAACREYGLRRTAAAAGAISCALGSMTIQQAYWQPVTILGSFAWLPAAAACCERLLVRPRFATAVLLGVLLTLQLLAAYPQYLLFSYIFIALRVAWAFATRTLKDARITLGALALGLTLPLVLGAIQLVPMMEMASLSVRNRALRLEEIKPGAMPGLGWKLLVQAATNRFAGIGTFLTVVGCSLAAIALAKLRVRRMVLFQLLVVVFCILLSFDTPLQSLYLSVWPGSSFRYPERIMVVATFGMSVLIAHGVNSLLSPVSSAGRVPKVLFALAALVGLHSLLPLGFSLRDWALVVVFAIVAGAALFTKFRRTVAVALLAVVGADVWLANALHFFALIDGREAVYRHQDAFRVAMQRAGPNFRIYQVGYHQGFDADYGLMAKSAQVYGFPSPLDYEPQTSRRYAELMVNLVQGPDAVLDDLNVFAFFSGLLATNRPLLNVLGAAVLVVDDRARRPRSILKGDLSLVWKAGPVGVYENREAWPRAFYVPRIAVVDDAQRIRELVARGAPELRTTAHVERPPADGFLGSSGGTGEATIVEDASETLVIAVKASQPGFLSLSDQYYDGWRAEVNGIETPILRANYAFRAVRVPAGEATVVFRYRSRSLLWGAAISGCAVAGLTAVLVMARRRRRLRASSAVSRPLPG
jgi:hypothetical protein